MTPERKKGGIIMMTEEEVKKVLKSMVKDNSGKQGKWVDGDFDLTYCSECKQITFGEMPFCAWCGAENAEHKNKREKSAKWIKGCYFCTCSVCGRIGLQPTPFCGHCGAKMSNYGDISNGCGDCQRCNNGQNSQA